MTRSFRPSFRAGVSLACLLTFCLLLTQAAPAFALNDDPVLKRMDDVLSENARLREEAWKARRHGHDAAKKAQDALEASDDRLEKTRVDALAHVAGVSPAQVEALRKDGRSWGQAAGDLGVHPGFLGINKAPIYEPASVRKAIQAEKAGKGGKKIKRGKRKADAKALKAADASQGKAAKHAKGKKRSKRPQ
jgi:hypothetical protein